VVQHQIGPVALDVLQKVGCGTVRTGALEISQQIEPLQHPPAHCGFRLVKDQPRGTFTGLPNPGRLRPRRKQRGVRAGQRVEQPEDGQGEFANEPGIGLRPAPLGHGAANGCGPGDGAVSLIRPQRKKRIALLMLNPRGEFAGNRRTEIRQILALHHCCNAIGMGRRGGGL